MSRCVKVAVVGNGSVGKTSLLKQFVSQGFQAGYAQTIGIDFFEKQISVRGDILADVQIWDVGGQSINSKLLPAYLRNARAVLIVYDVTDQNSFMDIDDWIQRVQSSVGMAKQPDLYIVGNKADLFRLRQVSEAEHDNFWRSRGLKGGFFASAASGENVSRLIHEIAAASVGIKLTAQELDFLNVVLSARVRTSDDGGRTLDANKIEAEDRALELAKRRREAAHRSCSCLVS